MFGLLFSGVLLGAVKVKETWDSTPKYTSDSGHDDPDCPLELHLKIVEIYKGYHQLGLQGDLSWVEHENIKNLLEKELQSEDKTTRIEALNALAAYTENLPFYREGLLGYRPFGCYTTSWRADNFADKDIALRYAMKTASRYSFGKRIRW